VKRDRKAPQSASVKVVCPTDGEQVMPASRLVIDDADGVYRFACPTCEATVDKRLTHEIRALLRSVQVPTVEELCEAFAGYLADDRNVQRFLLEA
jgi:hypothetical protein